MILSPAELRAHRIRNWTKDLALILCGLVITGLVLTGSIALMYQIIDAWSRN